jgi:hypothetical protein
VIVLIAPPDKGGAVYVAPITHSQPKDKHAVAIPAAVKLHLGLDDAPSWIVTCDLNQFVWPGYDLRPIARGKSTTFTWGFLPDELFEAVKRGIKANRAAGLLKAVPR